MPAPLITITITICSQAVIAVVTVNDPVECLRHHQHYFPPAYLLYSESISHLLLLINSSINFLIYCVVVSVTFILGNMLP